MSNKCKGITKKDKRCQKAPQANSEYCHLHKDQAQQQVLAIKGLEMELPNSVQTVMRRGPAKTDEPGWIYVYTLKTDDNEEQSYWKIGRTKRAANDRVAEWPNARLKVSFYVTYNQMAERLVHKILDKKRIYRYAYEGGKHHSIWKSNLEPLMDTQNRCQDIEQNKWKLEARKKHVEWFVGDWKETKHVIRMVCDYVNTIKHEETK